MGVFGDAEMAAKPVNPILRFAEKILLYFILRAVGMAVAFGDDFLLAFLAQVENGRVIAAVK